MSVDTILVASEGTSCLQFPPGLSPLQSQPCRFWKSGNYTGAGVSKSVHCNAVSSNLWSRAELLRNKHVRFEVGIEVGCPHNRGTWAAALWVIDHMALGVTVHVFGCLPCRTSFVIVSEYLSFLSEPGWPWPRSWISLISSYPERTLTLAWFLLPTNYTCLAFQ